MLTGQTIAEQIKISELSSFEIQDILKRNYETTKANEKSYKDGSIGYEEYFTTANDLAQEKIFLRYELQQRCGRW